ncbi:MAG: cytochrome c oxidase subunit II [Acidimicrobiia bacterium]|nr:cytochrome c oxidase subunit II [Acidimicrobiia bacterium]
MSLPQRKGASRRHRRPLALAVLVAGLVLTACAGDDPTNLGRVVDGDVPQNSLNPAGPIADKVDSLFWLVFWMAVVIFVIVSFGLVFAILRFRERKGVTRSVRQVHGNTRLEIAWTIVPAVILAVVAVPTLSTLFEIRTAPAPEDDALEIEVIGHQWWWEFRYPEYGFTTANEMHVPMGRPVYLTLTSADVIHSFWVPRLAGKRDAVPGRTTNILFETDEEGTFIGQCAEFCGLAHADMRQRVFSHPEAEFEAWALAQAAPATLPTEGAALAGWEVFQTQCISCHAIDGTSATAQFAPNLTHFASRTSFAGATLDNTEEHLREWLRNPSSLKPMTPERNDLAAGRVLGMPDLGLTEQQITDLIAFLETLR